MSPLVHETNLTWWPVAAHFAPTPPSAHSQSSGWAPNAMMRSLPSCGASMSAAGAGLPSVSRPREGGPEGDAQLDAASWRARTARNLFIGISLSGTLQGEQFLQFFGVRLTAVFADLERLGIFDLGGLLRVPLLERLAEFLGLARECGPELLPHLL